MLPALLLLSQVVLVLWLLALLVEFMRGMISGMLGE